MTELSSTITIAPRTERVLCLSDAVFAIAITFLALDLGDIPESVGVTESALAYVHDSLPRYAVYAASFGIISGLPGCVTTCSFATSRTARA